MNWTLVASLAGLVAHSLAGSALSADDGARRLTSAQSQVIARSAAWGVITPLADGSLGVVFQQARMVEEFDCTNVCMKWIRSTDGGQTWSEPTMVSERLGPDGTLFTKRDEGGFIVYQQRNQALGQLPSGRIVCAFGELDYFRDKNGEQENRPGKNYAHETQGIAYTWSDDLGKTWVKTRRLPLGPFGGKPDPTTPRGVSPHWRIVPLGDGTALMTLYGSYDPEYQGPIEVSAGTKKLSGVIRSTDNGETWGDISLILTDPNDQMYEETALCLLEDKLLAHVRTPRHDVVQYTSTDGGRNWQGPAPVTEPGQQPGGAFRLASGKLLMTWGNRRPPFGAAAMLSHDGGKTWDYEHRVSLGWEAPGANCGYANGAQAGDGTIVVMYYVMPNSPGNYRKLWGDSVVYAVRFTEAEFVKASSE